MASTSPAARVHGRQPGLQAWLAGELGWQADDREVHQPVDPRRSDFGGMAERRRELVAMRGAVDPVEPGGTDEPAAGEGGGVCEAGQGAPHGRVQPGGGHFVTCLPSCRTLGRRVNHDVSLKVGTARSTHSS
jgi:hypothetical protein